MDDRWMREAIITLKEAIEKFKRADEGDFKQALIIADHATETIMRNYLLENDIQQAYFLSDFLTRFDRSHYDHFLVFARVNKLLGRKKEARKSYQEAIKICKRDKKWRIWKRTN